MATKAAVTKVKKNFGGRPRARGNGKEADDRPRFDFRYKNSEHQKLVAEAAGFAGQSINAWLVERTLRMAREEIAEARKLTR
jgi:uncharacterized protein (DUF1778 family)